MKKILLSFVAAIICMQTFAQQLNNGKKILIVATNSSTELKTGQGGWGCFMPEITDFYSTMHKFGFRTTDIDIVSPNGGFVPIIADMPEYWELEVPAGDEEKLRDKLHHTLKPGEVDPSDYNVIYYAGGLSCLVDFPESDAVAEIAAKIYENGGVVGLVCDGISGLIPIKLSTGKYLVDGVKATTNGYSEAADGIDVEDILTANGGQIINRPLVVDKRVVTGRGVQPIQVASEITNLLGLGRFATSVGDVTTTSKLNCYPNPASGSISVSLPENEKATSYTIYSMTGNVVSNGTLQNNSTISLQGIAPGQYVMHASSKNNSYKSVITVN